MDPPTRAGEELSQNFCFELALESPPISAKRREVGNRMVKVYEQFSKQFLRLTGSAHNSMFNPHHSYSLTVDIIEDLYTPSDLVTEGDVEESEIGSATVEWLMSLRERMGTLDEILGSLDPPSDEDLYPDSSQLTALMWSCFSFLFLDVASKDSNVDITPQSVRGIFSQDGILDLFCKVVGALPSAENLTWGPNIYAFSEYVADGLARIYEILMEYLGKLLDYYCNCLPATESDPEAQNEEGDNIDDFLTGFLETLKSTTENIMTAANDEREWRDSLILHDMETARMYREDSKAAEACQLLEQSIRQLNATPPAPPGVDPLQIHLILSYELYETYEILRDRRNMLVWMNRIHELHTVLQGRHALTTLMKASTSARLLQELDKQDPVVVNILASVAEGVEKSKGLDHILTGYSLRELGSALISQNQIEKGVNSMLRALDIFERDWGSVDANAKDSARVTAKEIFELYCSEGQFAKARDLCLRMVESCTKNLGPEHTETCKFLNDLGFVYLSLKNIAEAEPVIRRACAGLEAGLGSEHPEVLRAMSHLASLYWLQSRLEESIIIERRLVEIYKRTSGPSSYRTLQSMANLAASLTKVGESEERTEVLRSIQRKFDEMDDPTSYGSLYYQTTVLLAEMPKTSEIDIEMSKLEKQLELLNVSSPSFLNRSISYVADRLIGLYQRSERMEDAYFLAKRALDSCFSRGPDHPDTQSFRWQTVQSLLELKGRDEETVETIRIGLSECQRLKPGSKEAVLWEEALGISLIKAGDRKRGLEVLRSALLHASLLYPKSDSCYRQIFQRLFQYYTEPLLKQDADDATRGDTELWETIIGLLQP